LAIDHQERARAAADSSKICAEHTFLYYSLDVDNEKIPYAKTFMFA